MAALVLSSPKWYRGRASRGFLHSRAAVTHWLSVGSGQSAGLGTDLSEFFQPKTSVSTWILWLILHFISFFCDLAFFLMDSIYYRKENVIPWWHKAKPRSSTIMKRESSETLMSGNEMRNSQSWDHGEMHISLPPQHVRTCKRGGGEREEGGLFF